MQQLIRDIVASDERIDPSTGEPYVVSISTVKRWMKNHKIKSYKTSAIAEVRATKATAELRDHWFNLVEDFVKHLFAEGKVIYDTYDKVPAVFKWNMDEEGADADKGRAPALASGVTSGDKGQRRLYEICSDGKMSFHTTDACTTCADGTVLAPLGATCIHRHLAPVTCILGASARPPPSPPGAPCRVRDSRHPATRAPYLVRPPRGG